MSDQFLILDAIGVIDDAYLEQYFVMKQALAQKAQRGKRARTWIALSAACLALAVILIIGAALSGRFDQPVYLENGKIDIASLPGAQVVQEIPDVSPGVAADIFSDEEFVYHLKNSDRLVVYGTPQNLQTVKIEGLGPYSWYITTFEICVIEELLNGGGAQTVTAVASVRYYNEKPEYICGLSSDFEILEQATGLFVLDQNADLTWEVAGMSLNVADLADYRAISQYECDGKSFNYFGGRIDLDELRAN